MPNLLKNAGSRLTELSEPSVLEQKFAQAYVWERALIRPTNSILSSLLRFFFVELITFFSAVCIVLQFCSKLTDCLSNFCWILVAANVILGFFFLKKIVLFLIKLYQCLAPLRLRRRCCLVPTCSEYALIVIDRDGCLKGIPMVIRRLVNICSGSYYRIHNP